MVDSTWKSAIHLTDALLRRASSLPALEFLEKVFDAGLLGFFLVCFFVRFRTCGVFIHAFFFPLVLEIKKQNLRSYIGNQPV